MRQSLRSSCAALVALLAVSAGCGPRSYRPIESGKESVYQFLNQGEPKAALALLQNCWSLGPRLPVACFDPITWTEDPFHEPYWRFLFYSLRPTTNLLWAYYASGEVRYRDKLLEILRSFAAHDRARGYDKFSFDNEHAAAFRGLVLTNSIVKLRRSNDLPADLDAELTDVLARLGVFLADPKNYQADNNHGFSEAAALLLLAENFPALRGAPGWRDLALERLDRLMVDTVDPDGVQVENSPFYHFYVLAFSLEILSWARRYEVPLSSKFGERTLAMVRYATHVVQPDGGVPMLGASVTMDARSYRPDVLARLDEIDPEFAYMRSGGIAGREPKERHLLFPSSGHALLRSGWGPAEELASSTHILFDVGAYRTAHSQLDGLSLIYYAGGRTLLPDSGLFSYDSGEDFDYFNSTRAHNTVVIDGRDQAAGPVEAGLTTGGAGWAYQSGAHTLYPGVTHRRATLLLRRDLTLVVDRLESAAAHDYVQTWHLFPEAELKSEGLSATALAGAEPKLVIQQALPAGLALVAKRGAGGPLQGWHSAVYEQKVPNHALEYRLRGSDAWLVTLLSSGPYAVAPPQAVVTEDGAGLRIAVCAPDAPVTVVLQNPAGPAEAVALSPGATCGR